MANKSFHVYLTSTQKTKLEKILNGKIELKKTPIDHDYNKPRFNVFPEEEHVFTLRQACRKLGLTLHADSVQ